MTVYVSEMRKCLPNRRWPWAENAYLVATTEAELREFAGRLGLFPRWIQRRGVLIHYGLTAGKRAAAIELGAREAKIAKLIRDARDGRLTLATTRKGKP